jgi:parallel beta helix pectate lyase-like protein/dockerin type I repeat protein
MRAFFAVLAALVVPAALAHAQVVQITSGVSTNTTWGPTGTVVGTIFWVRNSVGVNSGVKLDIQPGVIVKFDPFTTFTVSGTLNAVGTSGSPIVLTSIHDDVGGDTNGNGSTTAGNASDWAGITFPDAAPDTSRLEHCDLRFGGYFQRGVLVFSSNSSRVLDSVVRRSYYGIDCQGSAAPTITNTSIEASTYTPMVLDLTAAPVLSNLVFSIPNNGYEGFGLRGGTLTTTATLPLRGATVGANPVSNVTYVLLSNLTISAAARLTISPGVVIKPLAGNIAVSGNLTMNGTASDTISITSIHDDNAGQPADTNNNGSITAPSRGDWGQIAFAAGATGSLNHCRLRFGTNAGSLGMVDMTNLAIPISNTSLSDAAHGVALRGTSQPVLSDVLIRNCSSTPVLMSVTASPTFTNVSFLANALTALGIMGETVVGDARLSPRTVSGFGNITYAVLNSSLVVQSPAVLTVDPGVVIKFPGCQGLVVHGALVADGKPESLIVFTSQRDDQYGNPPDTNGDGSLTAPNTHDWAYVRFMPTSNDALSKLDHCRLTYGSSDCFSSYPGNLWITSAAPTVTNCTISKANQGIRIDGNSTPLVDQCEIDNCLGAPFILSAQADPTLTGNSFSTNGFNAIALLGETLSQDATLEYRPGVGPPSYPPFAYLPVGTITVPSGLTLAVEPQVVIKPLSTFGLIAVQGALNMVGGAGSQRIVITSLHDDTHAGDTNANGSATSPAAGHWGWMEFQDTSADAACILRNCLFQFGAGTGQAFGVVTTVSASPRLARLEFFQNRTALTFKGSSQPVVDTASVLNCTQLPIVSSLLSDPSLANITLANNNYTALGILGETVAQNVRTRVRSVSGLGNIGYALAGDVYIASGARWTIDPGVVIKLGRWAVDPLGSYIEINGALIADGTPDSLIVFTSSADDAFGGDTYGDGALSQPVAGHWYGIQFNDISSDTASRIDHCRIRYAGLAGYAGLRFIHAGPTVSNTVVTSCASQAVSIEGTSTPTFTDCAFDSSSAPVQMSLVSNPAFNNVQFLGNAYTALQVIPETIAQDLLWRIRAVSGRQNMPYLIAGTLTIGLATQITVQPGVIVKFNGGGINVQRGFLAEGRTQPESLIVFTSVRDDFYGGDTDNNGGALPPGPGQWGAVTVEGTAIDPQVRFRNCVLRYGGSGAIRAVNSSPSIDSCIVAFNTTGISVEGASNPLVRGCSIYGNNSFGINNVGASFCINAEGNWWGAASGPNDNSATADLCGLGSNAGTGDRVSNHVDYQPFAASGIVNPLLGDVSLNGQVLAYDASLILQYVVTLISLSDLQKLVADVSGQGGITAFDASLILQYVAGIIRAFPAASNAAQPAPPDVLAARAIVARARGSFEVVLGAASRQGDEWSVPVLVRGDAPVYAVELALEGASAEQLAAVASASGVLTARSAAGRRARVAVAAAAPLGTGEVAVLRFRVAGAEPWQAPALAAARVNEIEVPLGSTPGPVVPSLSFLRPAAPNPASGPVRIELGIAAAEAGAARVMVLDPAGRRVRVLLDGAVPTGVRSLTWDLRDQHGRRVRAGVYLIRARAGSFAATTRLAVVG